MGRSPLVVSVALQLICSCTGVFHDERGQGSPEAAGAENSYPPSPVIFEPTSSSSPVTPAATGTLPPGSTDATCYKGDPLACQIEVLIVQKTNALRNGRGALRGDSSLSYVARQWSDTQAQRGDIGHDGFPNQRQRVYSQEFGGAATVDIAAENVAMSGYGEGSAEAVAETFTTMWWESPGHRANMEGDYSVLGVGMARRGDGWYGTQIFGN